MNRKAFIALLASVGAWFATKSLPQKAKPGAWVKSWGISSRWSEDSHFALVMGEVNETVIFYESIQFPSGSSDLDKMLAVNAACDQAREKIRYFENLA